MGLTAAQKAALAAKKRAAAAAKNSPAPASIDPPANTKPKPRATPSPAPVDAPRNPRNIPMSQRLDAALKAAGATDAQIAAADTILEKDELLRSLKNPPIESNITGDPDVDPISTPAELGPVPKKKGQRKGKKNDTPAPIEEDDGEMDEEPVPKKKGRSTKGQSRDKKGKYNLPEGPLPEAATPAKKSAPAATKKAKKAPADENLDAEEEEAPANKVSGMGSYLPGAEDPFVKPIYGAVKYAYKRPVQSALLAYLAAQALSQFAPKPAAKPAAPPQEPSDKPPQPYTTDIDMPGANQRREDMPMGGQLIPQEQMAEGMEQDGERRFFFEKPANPAGTDSDIIRQYRNR